jgi:phosphoribosylformylglycinamidine synthase subunit PurSL
MPNESATLWEVELAARPGRPDPEHGRAEESLRALAGAVKTNFGVGLPSFTAARGFLIETTSEQSNVEAAARRLLTDPVVESAAVRRLDDSTLPESTLTVMRKPGVMDPVASSAEHALKDAGIAEPMVRQFRRYAFAKGTPQPLLKVLASKALANEAVEQIVFGTVHADHLGAGEEYRFRKVEVPIRDLDDAGLARISKEGGLSLIIEEMRTIQQHYRDMGRNPTDVELETIAQTWSEHCSHKTFRGPYTLNGERGKSGLLKDTIMHATRTLNKDWCVSVFSDNAGVVKFDDKWNLCIKVETHNRPSAIEPYGGANTGLGGVLRDVLGAGLGAKPICSTDVFCVAPPTTPNEIIPEGVLHPERVLRGITAGVRDYGNRMGVPTLNGAVVCDERYLGNPLVFCGTVGLLPADKSFKKVEPGDLIVAVGGRTGRDGIHGATFSSGELTHESEKTSGGAVQIGNAIEEKKVAEFLIRARDEGLFNAVTDCGAGGFSSAVGEMGANIGARVALENAPLKYAGLSYAEIWISEAQERMVFAVPESKLAALKQLAQREEVEVSVLGVFEPTGRLKLTYHGEQVADMDMHFLHEGRPSVLREGVYKPTPVKPHAIPKSASKLAGDIGSVLHAILKSWNVASKEWIVRQYDHEVLGGTVIKPFVGVGEGPGDAAVITPIRGSFKGAAIGCGLQPQFGDDDAYAMAGATIDEAIRNVVAVGADPTRVAILDNFCWGNIHRPETFGSLVAASQGCRDFAIAYGTPFVSGKDSLNNEFVRGEQRIVIPPTLLVTALGIVPDVRRATTMDFKKAGNLILIVGATKPEMGGSHFNLVTGATGGSIPRPEAASAVVLFQRVHQAISEGLVRSCHDASEVGLVVALAEMAFSGGLGAEVDFAKVPAADGLSIVERLFSESCSRFILEVTPENFARIQDFLKDSPNAVVGTVTSSSKVRITNGGDLLVDESIDELKQSWQSPLDW